MDRATLIAGVIALALAGCARPARIVVGSKNFSEQVLLGEILAQQLERRGFAVERKLNLGGTMLAHEALVKGDLDLYPEYTGTALTAVLKQPPVSDRAAALDAVRSAYRARWQLVWLAPLGFNNTFAMVVRNEKANLKTLSEAAAAQPWRLGVGYEFQQRPDGLAGLVKTYGLRIAGDPVTMDLGLLYQALTARKVDLIAANSTDGLLSALPVKVLDDDRHYFPPYECAVVVRAATLERYPKLRAALDELAGKLTDATMRRLNFEVDGKHRPAAGVAGEYLRAY
jgi:osmoprotectant transport system substrate-binding protein